MRDKLWVLTETPSGDTVANCYDVGKAGLAGCQARLAGLPEDREVFWTLEYVRGGRTIELGYGVGPIDLPNLVHMCAQAEWMLTK